MTDTSKFPPDVSKLFEPRPPLRFVEQIDVAPKERKTAYISGIGSFLEKLKEYKEIEFPKEELEETPLLKQQREKKEKQLLVKQKLDEDFGKWNPSEDPHIKGDPYKTLFIGRLDYEVTEIDLQKEFSKYGEVERVRVVRDKDTGKSKGYAFILFDRDSSAKAAFKEANGLKIKGRAIITDIERARTFKSWVPRRLGGGLGGRGYIKRQLEAERAPKGRYDSGPSGPGRGRGGSRFGSRGGPIGGGRGGRGGGGGGYERTRGPPSGYDSRPARYTSRSERPSDGDRYDRPSGITRYESRSERPERPERAQRTERFEYNSRSKREDRDFNDRDRDRERDSRVISEREKSRLQFKERKMEQASQSSMRY